MKRIRRLLAVLAVSALFLSLAIPALAVSADGKEPPAEPEIVSIRSLRELLDFAEACTETAYSEGRTFSLECSIQLSGSEFTPVPYFAGTFLGNGHSISGLSLTADGSRQGLFRIVTASAEIRELNVSGQVTPGGTGCFVGGIAGTNEGRILNCSFSGTVRGRENVGGIAGRCGADALVEDCAVSGTVSGEHFVGGVCGCSEGVLRRCRSEASVNTEPVVPAQETRFDLSGFDLSALSSDDYLDITDLGGICGKSTGVIDSCQNSGDVGYHYTGYNVGGIAGLTGGYVTGCTNSGAVLGRKDVGGIAGQLVPYVELDLKEGKFDSIEQSLRKLNGSISSASALVGDKTGEIGAELEKASASASAVTEEISGLMEKLRQNGESLGERISRDEETGEIRILPGEILDSTALVAAVAGLYAEYKAILRLVSTASGELMDRLIGVTSDITGVMSGLNAAMQNANWEIEELELSVDEAYDHDRGAVDHCVNRGSVTAEGYDGGVVGSIGYELDFDKENLTDLGDSLVSEVKQYIFAVIRASESYGRVEVKNDYAGGVVGRGELGAVPDCTGAGYIVSLNGGYVGGIAGSLHGTVLNCCARPVLAGGRYVGGLAGEAESIRGGCVYAAFDRYGEYAGAVAGWVTGELGDILYVKCRPAGVDGVSYSDVMQAVSYEELLQREALPDVFREITVRFIGPDGEPVRETPVEFGESVTDFPEVPMDGEQYWRWDVASLDNVCRDTEVHGQYYRPVRTLSTGGDVPLFLVEGSFYEGQTLTVTELEEDSADGRIAAHRLSVTDHEGKLTVRMFAEGSGRICRLLPDGSTAELPSATDGRYRVFTAENDAVIFFEPLPERIVPVWVIAAASLGLAGLLALLIVRRRRKKATAE